MKTNLNNFFKHKKTSLLTLLGFIFLFYYIWFRFIRQRLPQHIPFDLTLLRLAIILIIIICFSLVIKQFIKPSTNIHLQQIIYDILVFITYPFIMLDNYLKNNKLFKSIIKVLFKIFFADTFNHKDSNFRGFWLNKAFYIKAFILPKILLVILFLFDVFYFHKLFLIYAFIILAALPLIWAYFLYLMQYYQEQYTCFLETWYEVEELDKEDYGDGRIRNSYIGHDGDDGQCTIRNFLFLNDSISSTPVRYKCSLKAKMVHAYFNIDNIHISEISHNLIVLPWIGIPNESDDDRLNSRQRDYLEKDFYDLIPLVIHMYEFTQDYNFFKERFNKEIKYKVINIIVYSLYLIGWTYILILSLPSLHLLPFEEIFLNNFQDYYEPFSGNNLF